MIQLFKLKKERKKEQNMYTLRQVCGKADDKVAFCDPVKQKEKSLKTGLQHLAGKKQKKTNSGVTDMKQECAALQCQSGNALTRKLVNN